MKFTYTYYTQQPHGDFRHRFFLGSFYFDYTLSQVWNLLLMVILVDAQRILKLAAGSWGLPQ